MSFHEDWHISLEAQLILNKFLVYKTLCIPVKIIKKERKMHRTESKMFVLSCAYEAMRDTMAVFHE